jgi:hypothetical protein
VGWDNADLSGAIDPISPSAYHNLLSEMIHSDRVQHTERLDIEGSKKDPIQPLDRSEKRKMFRKLLNLDHRKNLTKANKYRRIAEIKIDQA